MARTFAAWECSPLGNCFSFRDHDDFCPKVYTQQVGLAVQLGSILSGSLSALRPSKTAVDAKAGASSTESDRTTAKAIEGPSQPATPSKSLAETAREKLMADYKKAEADGDYIVDDIAGGGRLLDASNLDDEELAAVVNEKGFSEREVMAAKVEFGVRVKASLAPFTTPRDSALAVKAIYPTLSPAVKKAMGWNESMLYMGERIIKDQGGPLTHNEDEAFFNKLRQAARARGGLKFDINLVNQPGAAVNLVA